MSVYKKLQKARVMLLSSDIKKSGKNKFAGFEYFELSDFLPAITNIFDSVGLCGTVRFDTYTATLTIIDSDEPFGAIEFITPLVYAENAKGQAIQSLGATHTYMRRYLWLMAMEIVEHDSVDAAPQAEKPKEIKQEAPLVPKGATEDQKLFVDKLIEWAAVQDTKSKLFGAWKANQKQIDALKVSDPKLFNHFKTCFTELKDNIKE